MPNSQAKKNNNNKWGFKNDFNIKKYGSKQSENFEGTMCCYPH